MEAAVDANTRVFQLTHFAGAWLSLRLDALGSLVVAVTGLVAVVPASQAGSGGSLGVVSGGYVGLALTYAVTVLTLLAGTIQSFVSAETSASSVERVRAYAALPSEPPARAPQSSSSLPPPGWPAEGAISFRDLTVAYRPGMPPALRGVSLEIPAGTRVGICGRTGSGEARGGEEEWGA